MYYVNLDGHGGMNKKNISAGGLVVVDTMSLPCVLPVAPNTMISTPKQCQQKTWPNFLLPH